MAELAYVFDNSRLDHGLTYVMTARNGYIRKLGGYLPDWLKQEYAGKLKDYLESKLKGS
jgi:hypothetical protein